MAITEFTVPTASSQPFSLAVGSDGAIWFTEVNGNKIGRITTGGAITEFTAAGNPGGIAAGADGDLWYTEIGGNKIARITTGGAITEFAVPTASAVPHQIAAGLDGALWFTEIGTNKIGRITTAGAVTEFTVPTASSQPFGIVAGPDGALWFTEIATGASKVGRISTSGSITEFAVGQNPSYITVGADGALWFAESDTEVTSSISKIGRLTTSGTFTQFSPPTSASFPQGIVAGPDGALWFVEESGNKVGRVTTGGVFSEFSLPTAGAPFEIATGPDGNLWFVEFSGNKIAEISPSAPAFDTSWTLVGTGDFQGNGKSELIWHRASDGLTELQFQNGVAPTALSMPTNNSFGATWNIAAIGDFDDSGRSSLLWRRQSDGLAEIQFLNGSQGIGGGVITNNPFDLSWNIVATGDLNGDSKSDLVWQRASDGTTEIQFLNGAQAIGGGEILNNSFGRDWQIVASGDFSGNGQTDLVWRRPTDGTTEIQFLNGTQVTSGGAIVNNAFGSNWRIVASGDFNGDGKADLVWQRPSDGIVEVQFLSGNVAIGGGEISSNSFDSSWNVVGTGKFDGHTDLVWRHASDGTTEIQFLNGIQAIGGGLVASGGASTIASTQLSQQLAQGAATLAVSGTDAAGTVFSAAIDPGSHLAAAVTDHS